LNLKLEPIKEERIPQKALVQKQQVDFCKYCVLEKPVYGEKTIKIVDKTRVLMS